MSDREWIVSPAWLAARLATDDDHVRVVDVRWRLGQPGAGRALFEAGHVPGAAHVDVDADLAEVDAGSGHARGRHPLPDPDRLAARLAALGIGRDEHVIAYDDAGGAHAARLVWLVRALGGHASLLDGGLPAWIESAGLIEPIEPMEQNEPSCQPTKAPLAGPYRAPMIDKLGLARALADGRPLVLLDARAAERYRGDVEPIDPRAGHIPTARSAPTSDNLDGHRFRSPEALRARFASLGVSAKTDVVCYCGSGVTACHDLIALAIAGFPVARLYPGSFSEWSRDETLPVAAGAEPGDFPRG